MSQDFLQNNLLKDSEPRTRSGGLLEGVISRFPIVLFRLDSDGVITESTGLGLKRLGLSEGELVGRRAVELYPEFAGEIREVLAGGEIQFETQGVTDGRPWRFDTRICHDPEHDGASGIAFDITSKNQKGAPHQRPERRFGELLETMSHGIVEIDMAGRIIFCNHGFAKLIEARHGALLGCNIAEFEVLAGGSEALKPYLESIVKHSSSCDPYLTVMRTTTGKEVDVRVDWNRKRTGSGKVSGFVSIITDITVQERAKKALVESEEKFSRAFHVCPDSMTISRMPDGEFIEVNEGFSRITGYSCEEALGKTAVELGIWLDNAGREEFINELKRVGNVRDMQVRFRMKSGAIRICLISAELFDLAGRTCYLALSKDITENHETECRLRETSARLKLALKATQSGIWDWDIKSGHININERWAEIMGYEPDEIIPHINSWREMVHPDDRQRMRETWRRYELGESSAYEASYRMKGKDGDYRVILDAGKIVEFDVDGAPLRAIGIHVDISERTKREQIESCNAKLKSVGVLAGGIAHDFNNVLAAIVGELDLIRMGIDDGEDVSEDITACENRAFKATRLTQQLLSFSRGGAPLCVPTQVRDIVDGAVEAALSGFAGELRNHIPENSPSVDGDSGQLQQALSALLVNAAEALSGGGAFDCSITVSMVTQTLLCNNVMGLAPGDYVSLSIADDGPGIAAEDLDKIFDPFFTTKKGASGLGLTGAHAIAQKHGGALLVESHAGEGATFFFLLPEMGQSENVHERVRKTANSDGGIRDIPGNVLVMDDEESICKVATRSLSRLSYTTHVALNGEQALDIYQRQMRTEAPIDIVILDLTVVSGMGGAETIAALKKMDPDVTAFVSSGYCNDPVMANFAEYGFVGALAKPYRMADLHQELQAVLAKKRTEPAS